MHQEAYRFIEEQVKSLPPRRSVVELGARDVNGSVRALFGDAAYVSVDIADGPGVDVVADAATFRPIEAPDTVVCCETLEHAPQAGAIVRNAIDMLAPGGVLLVTCASDPRAPHSGIDGGAVRPGEWYQNVPLDALAKWLEGTGVIHLRHLACGDLQAHAVKR
jgi:SAM-dependent methyltransferase